ncbi:MAG: 50S ribosomal protein L35ae [Candidatus Methanomethylicaceae archaeon]|nr:50S ribosomal protein L35ae [Candidatus Verstraetearchaeota archaeon]
MIIGEIMNFRIGTKRRYPRELLIKFGNSRIDIAKLIGKKVVVEDKHGNKYIGKVIKPHGNKGVAIVRFRKDPPGEVLGSKAICL